MPIKINVLKKYKSNYFIETGSYLGETIQKAINCGFEKIYSIELAKFYYEHCIKKFKDNVNVEIIFGNSGDVLDKIISKLEKRGTFWLDGHYSGGQTAKGKKKCPIIEELEQIKKSTIKNHILLIDDVRLFGKKEHDFTTIDEVKNKILEINPKYQFKFEDGHIKNDILVAFIEEG